MSWSPWILHLSLPVHPPNPSGPKITWAVFPVLVPEIELLPRVSPTGPGHTGSLPQDDPSALPWNPTPTPLPPVVRESGETGRNRRTGPGHGSPRSCRPRTVPVPCDKDLPNTRTDPDREETENSGPLTQGYWRYGSCDHVGGVRTPTELGGRMVPRVTPYRSVRTRYFRTEGRPHVYRTHTTDTTRAGRPSM